MVEYAKEDTSVKTVASGANKLTTCFQSDIFLSLFDSEDGDDMFL
jgi:hypothetical protein